MTSGGLLVVDDCEAAASLPVIACCISSAYAKARVVTFNCGGGAAPFCGFNLVECLTLLILLGDTLGVDWAGNILFVKEAGDGSVGGTDANSVKKADGAVTAFDGTHRACDGEGSTLDCCIGNTLLLAFVPGEDVTVANATELLLLTIQLFSTELL